MSGVDAGSARNSDNEAAVTAQFGGESATQAASATRDEDNFLGEIKCAVRAIHECNKRYGEVVQSTSHG